MSMSEEPESSKPSGKSDGNYRVLKTKMIPKGKQFFYDNQSSLGHNLDDKCVYEFPNPLINIEYPGQIKNIDKAIETLGGLKAIQKAIDGESKLELKFHPESQYAKGCVADKESLSGLLVKVKQKSGSDECSYEIINSSNISFKFNRMCDFQYEPLVSKNKPENKESEVRYVHRQIIPEEIPNMAWLKKNTTKETPIMLTPSSFSKFDKPQTHFQTDSVRAFLSIVRPDFDFEKYESPNKTKKKEFIFNYYKFKCIKPDTEIPSAPNPLAMEILKERRGWDQSLKLINSLFDERPVWRKVAVSHKTKLSYDLVRFGLPCVAYYSTGAPWSNCWIKFGYNPATDINSRMYQTIDFRMRSNGSQLKVKTRKALWKLSHSSDNLSENQYVLKPGTLPQARQMHYQYCDILLPEIQEMFSKLPKHQEAANYDIKNGWLPINFTEQCREIMNKYILEAVQKELLMETKIYRQSEKLNNPDENTSSSIVSVYCNKMLSNIDGANEGNEEKIDLVEDTEDDEHVDADEIVNILPESISDCSDDDSDSETDTDFLKKLGNTAFTENQSETEQL